MAVVDAIRAGAAAFLVKPLRSNELSTLWQHVWRRRIAASPMPMQMPTSFGGASATAIGASTHAPSTSGGSHASHNSDNSSSGCFSPGTPPLAGSLPLADSDTPMHRALLPPPGQQRPLVFPPAPAGAAMSPFCRPSSPPPATPSAPARSAPAALGAATSASAAGDEAVSMEVSSAAPPARNSIDAGCVARASVAANTSVKTPLASTLFPAASAALPAAFGQLRSLCLPLRPAATLGSDASLDLSVDLSIRPLDVTPKAASPSAACDSTAPIQGLSFGSLSAVAPHRRCAAQYIQPRLPCLSVPSSRFQQESAHLLCHVCGTVTGRQAAQPVARWQLHPSSDFLLFTLICTAASPVYAAAVHDTCLK